MGLNVQVEHDFPYLLSQPCRKCVFAKLLNPEGGILPFADASFDGVLSNNVLEHALNPKQYLRESLRVLRPGGVFHAVWEPTYGAANGHHLNQGRGRGLQRMHNATQRGQEDYLDSMLPAYLHLLVDRDQAYQLLRTKLGEQRSLLEAMLHFIYDDLHISRLGAHVVHDELLAMQREGLLSLSSFRCKRPSEKRLPRSLQELLLRRHPELTAFDINAQGCSFVVHRLNGTQTGR